MIPWKRYVSPTVGLLIALTAAVSLVAAIDARGDGDLYNLLALRPMQVWQGELWRLVTWILVEASPFSLFFGCVSLAWFGGDLAEDWGQGRFARFVIAVVLIAGVGTSLVALVVPDAWWFPHLGGWALGDALVVAWALQFPDRTIRIYQVLVVGGPLLAYGTVGFTLVCMVFYGVAVFLPEMIAAVASLLYMTGWWRRMIRA